MKWARKNADRPLTEGKRWAVERFQFGSCMFEPMGLKDRYTRLVAWKGMWVNYWTQTVPREEESAESDETKANQVAENDAALVQADMLSPPVSPAAGHGQKPSSLGSRKQSEADVRNEGRKKKVKSGQHFVVLPTALGEVLGGAGKWEKVLIEGANDEVAAHCGLFIRDRNLDYEGLVERVGSRIFGWCEKL
jgi:hypothetical protein